MHILMEMQKYMTDGWTNRRTQIDNVVKAAEMASTRVDLVGLYHAFRNVCIERGLSVGPVAETLGIQTATLSRMRHDKINDIYAHSLLKICEWADLNPRDFLVKNRIIVTTKSPKEPK